MGHASGTAERSLRGRSRCAGGIGETEFVMTSVNTNLAALVALRTLNTVTSQLNSQARA